MPVIRFAGVWLQWLRWVERKHSGNKRVEVRPGHCTLMQRTKIFGKAGLELVQPLMRDVEVDDFANGTPQVVEFEADDGVRKNHPVLAHLAVEPDVEPQRPQTVETVGHSDERAKRIWPFRPRARS